jgi:streptogramin lyase
MNGEGIVSGSFYLGARSAVARRGVLAGLAGIMLALAAVLCFAASALAAPLGETSDFPTPTASSGPEAITAGPEGNLWFTEGRTDKVGEINPITHAISEFEIPTAGGGLPGIALGPEGNLWFTEYFANRVGEINPSHTL